MASKDFKRIYVWEIPVRIFHWANALCIVTLTITGLLIANPPALMSSAEANDTYLFGTVRFVHFAAAYFFVAVMVLRIYWSFVGNKYASWRYYMPFSKKAWRNITHVLKHDILLIPEKNRQLSNISIGHNYLATASYFLMFIFALIMIFTGFGMYADTSTWWFPKMFAWVVPMFGGDFAARMLHHVSMWFIWFIVILHIYLVLFHDWLEVRGETSAMLSGYKFIRKDRLEKTEEQV